MKKIYIFALSTFIGFNLNLMSQDESSDEESSESAADSAISGSVASPQSAPSGAIESNPLVLLVRSGAVSLNDALTLGLAGVRELQASFGNLDVSPDVFAATLKVKEMDSFVATDHQTALIEAATLANTLLTDRSITSSSDLPSSVTVDSFTASGYNIAFVNLLSKYGAIGASGDSLVSEILTGTMSDSLNDNGDLLIKPSTANYLSYLATYTGSASFGDVDSTSTVLDLQIDNISVSPGANIVLGSSTADSSVDVSSLLPKATEDHRSFRKAHVIGAAKDMTVSGNITFTNTNDAEDHALVLGAADDFMLTGSNLTYTGSNLALGAGGSEADSMYLVNTTITTGGNLASGTLGTLNISTAEFNVGNGGVNSDPDNVYLFANDLIQVNGLNFSGSRLDDVYMEAITVNLNNVSFPSTADVILKSRDGTLHFDTYSSPTVGGVNLTNVRHGSTVLSSNHFDGGPAGHIDSTISLPNGKSAVKIRKQY